MKNGNQNNIIRISVVAIIVAVVIAGVFYIVNGPTGNHELKVDKQRMSNVFYTKTAIDLFFREKGSLPLSLEELRKRALDSADSNGTGSRTYQNFLKETETEEYDITYKVTDGTNYKLCTAFLHDWAARETYWNYWENGHSTKWQHSAGPFCFYLEIAEKE